MTRKLSPRAARAAHKEAGAADRDVLIIEGLRQNNLKNLSLRIPHDRITAVVGPSGSGKSSLAFDTLFAEGRWRFIESLSTYTRMFLERMDRPDLDSIRNIRPAVAVEQKNPVRTSRSTVGTTTELNDYLRLLFSRIGRLHCPSCGAEVKAHDAASAANALLGEHSGKAALVGFTIDLNGKDVREVSAGLVKKGFIRAMADGEAVNISETEIKRPSDGRLMVVADRLILKPSERARLAGSIEAALREGIGAMWAHVEGRTLLFSAEASCAACSVKAERPTPLALSFNHPVGACPECRGFGNILSYDEDKIIPDRSLTLSQGAIEPWTKPAYTWWQEELERHAKKHNLPLDKPFAKLTKKERAVVFRGTRDFDGIDGFFSYLETKKYKLHIKVFTSRYKGVVTCSTCNGTRLKKSALSVKVGGIDIAAVSSLTISAARKFFKDLALTDFERGVAKEVLRQLGVKLEFLNQTGLGYITLDRLTKTLSGGEAQRVSLASHLASSLCGVLYILDEPSIGLHPADTEMLIEQIRRLSALGNTVVVVEHDPAVIAASDNVVELGPGSGDRGGRLVFSGPYADFLKEARTVTADYMTGRQSMHTPRWRRRGSGRHLTLKGATGNNLKSVDLRIPLRAMTCVTGVSGSGKSTLVVDTLHNALAARFGEKADKPLPFASLHGDEATAGVKLMDQGPIGRTPRSNPLTYIGGFDEVRRIYSSLPAARAHGLKPGHFSFNVPGGRCESCKGAGVESLEMYFLQDVYVKCASCGGKRYKPGVCEVKFRGRSINDCLETTFDEAARLFAGEDALLRRFSILREVGLGYLKLGQSATTLSGGEAQRLKVARELAAGAGEDMLYILDEPTTGLHPADVKKLLSVLGRLVDSGSTVIIIEHNLDVIKTADHVVDLGPGGGDSGGRIVAEGTPEDVARSKRSVTGRYLKEVLPS